VDVTTLLRREKNKNAFEKREGEKLTHPIFMEAVAKL
jgi:2-oxoglutarate dehydrogenase E2 component (dihydrolipoamide succinyltransferase)